LNIAVMLCVVIILLIEFVYEVLEDLVTSREVLMTKKMSSFLKNAS
jgi:hypothetical protein